MKKWKLVFLVLLAFTATVTPQSKKNSGLVLSGAVISVSPRLSTADDRPFAVYEVRLQLQLRNDGSVPLIVFNPRDCDKSIEFLRVPTYDADDVAEMTVSPWIPPKDPLYDFKSTSMPTLEQLLAPAQEPLQHYFVIIEPGKVFEFGESITLNNGFSLEVKPGQTWSDLWRNTPISEYEALRIQYRRPVKKIGKDENLFRTLQQRWKRYGHLPLDTNGDFAIKSETILNKTR